MKVIYSLIGVLIASNCYAGLLLVESNTYFSKRRGDDLKSEAPLFEELQASYINQERNLKLDFDFDYSYDFNRAVYNLDLNQLNFQMDIPKSKVHVSAGRTFESYHLIKSSTVDSVTIDYRLLDDQLVTGVLVGVLRNYEFDKYAGKAPVYTWFSKYKTRENFPWTFGIQLESADYSDFSRSTYETIKGTVKKELYNSEIFLNYQKGITLSDSYRREVGINFYPRYDWTYGFQYQEYEKNKQEGIEQSIFNTFSLGKIREFAGTLSHAFSSKLYSGLSLMVDSYPVQKDQETTGHKLNWNINYQLADLVLKGDLFEMKSFGGKAHGYNVNGQYAFNDYLDLILENEWVNYSKITSAKNQANMLRFGAGNHKIAPFRIQVLGEISSNNYYSEEWAFLFRLTFVDWREI